VEHTPQLVKRKRYIHRCRRKLLFLHQECFKFDLGVDIVQVWGDVPPGNNSQLDPLDGARQFLSLSHYSIVDPINPKLYGMVMGLSKDNNVAMQFIKFSKRRYQKINKKVWDKARETFDLTHSVAYTNVRGKTWHGTHSTYV
jgi:hypothetical protein